MMPRARHSILPLVIVSVFAAAVPFAHAGGGMGNSLSDTPNRTCRVIQNGASQPQRLTVIDAGTSGDAVTVGAAVLLCDLPAIATRTAGPVTFEPPVGANAMT